ncbi:MAG TPA: transcriptional repressor [Tissierellaceae bacterium]
MKHEISYLKDYLESYKINVSNIRIFILDILLSSDNHLTADEIYKELKNIMPTLSKTSVYNTLDLFIEKELIKSVKLDEKETRFDIKTSPHGHFKCIKCNKVYDFDINNVRYKDLEDFEILKNDIQLYGLCKNCR